MKMAEKTLYKNTKTFQKNFCNKLADNIKFLWSCFT